MIAVLRECVITLSWRHMECIEKDIHNLWSLYLTWCIVCCSQRFLSFIEAGTPSFAKNYVTKINVHVLAYVNALGELYIDVSETFFWKTLWKSDVFLVSWMTIFSYINKKEKKNQYGFLKKCYQDFLYCILEFEEEWERKYIIHVLCSDFIGTYICPQM